MDFDHDAPWLGVAEVARRAARHSDSVRRDLENGRLHGHQRCFRGRWTVHVDAVDAWIRNEPSAPACGCSEVARRRTRPRAS